MVAMDYVQIAGALGVGSVIPWGWRQLSRIMSDASDREVSRIESLEHLVDALRRALDKGRLREDALAQVLGVLIFGLRQIEDLSPALANAIERAIVILEKAQGQLQTMNDGAEL